MLLPVIILSYDLSPANDQKQRDARDWLRRLENAVSLRNEVEEHEQYFQDGLLEVDGLNRDLVECHGHVMWKRPQAYLALAEEMEKAMERYREQSAVFHTRKLSMNGVHEVVADAEKQHFKEVDKLHRSMSARLEFYKAKLKGLENYIHTTLERLKVQREAVRLTNTLSSLKVANKHSYTTSCPSAKRDSTSKSPENSAASPTPANATARP